MPLKPKDPAARAERKAEREAQAKAKQAEREAQRQAREREAIKAQGRREAHKAARREARDKAEAETAEAVARIEARSKGREAVANRRAIANALTGRVAVSVAGDYEGASFRNVWDAINATIFGGLAENLFSPSELIELAKLYQQTGLDALAIGNDRLAQLMDLKNVPTYPPRATAKTAETRRSGDGASAAGDGAIDAVGHSAD